MGNSASSGTHNPPVTNNPQEKDSREKHTPHPVHRSLRTKKKSLELPDLASLSLTPAPSHLNSPNHSPRPPHYKRPKPSSPIPIPSQSPALNGVDHHYQTYQRPNLPSTTQMPDVLVQQQPNTHIPVFPPAQRHKSTPNASTKSFTRPPHPAHLPPIRDVESGREPEAKVTSFLPETVHSKIPLGLALEDIPQPPTRSRLSPIDEPPHPVDVKISWHGGGKTVLLARAGDANWKGRQVMERRCVLHRLFNFATSCSSNPNHSTSDPDTFTATISLLPGTHHIKFVIDENWRLAQHLPTAVDDDGSLANYVSVPHPAGPSAPASPPPTSSIRTPHQISFWSQSSDAGASFGDEGWTSVIPSELMAAAREEELYLANPTAGTAPNIPPAPVLPRHLDKLILNTRVGAPPPAPVKDRRHRTRSRHGEFGMTKPEQDEPSAPAIPVTTASGTDVSSAALQGQPNRQSQSPVRTLVGGSTAAPGPTVAALMLSDDASVLPVPSHVVLHHLSTSAIRNGVLAVGNTTRYRKKVRHFVFSGRSKFASHISFFFLFISLWLQHSSLQRSITSRRDGSPPPIPEKITLYSYILAVDGATGPYRLQFPGFTIFFIPFHKSSIAVSLHIIILLHQVQICDAYDLDDIDAFFCFPCPARARMCPSLRTASFLHFYLFLSFLPPSAFTCDFMMYYSHCIRMRTSQDPAG